MLSRYRGLVPYLLVLAVALALAWNTFHFQFTPHGDRPGPDVWPRAILALIVVTCLVRILALLRRPFSSDPVMLKDVLETPSGAGAETASKRYPLLLVTGIGLTIAYVALLSTFGFFIGTALYIATLIRTGRYRRWPVIAVVALGGALAFMFVFMRIVYLSLPIGVPPFAQVSLMLMQLMGIR